ncbi:YchJ family protein [Demequina globuliformis]|uniref:YchJ family protein n=1 Tax=Demequina globuliformis TaxID=676202 RepID=UPI00078548A8|nr:YchJ family metal-binding protein [Demequina globuliformis]
MSGLPCPCSSGDAFSECCRPLLRGEREAETAEQLMRSRYTAHVRRDVDYVLRTWHPDTRPTPEKLGNLASPSWRGLDVAGTIDGESPDTEGTVTFAAHYETDDGEAGVLRETSTFVREDGRWIYLKGLQF